MLIDFDTVIIAFLLVYIIVAFLFLIIQKNRNKKTSIWKIMCYFFFWGYITLVISVTLFPVSWPPSGAKMSTAIEMINLNPILSISQLLNGFIIMNIAGNVIMFVPLLPLMQTCMNASNLTFKRSIFVSLAISCGIEFLQFCEDALGFCTLFPRSVDIMDVILNVIGGIIGYIVLKGYTLAIKKMNNNI